MNQTPRMKRGFSLLELAIVLGVSSLMAGFVLKATRVNNSSACYAATKQQLFVVKGAIDSYVRKNDRYPMPANRMLGMTDPNYGRETPGGNTTSNGIAYGALPFVTLGLPTTYAGDCWGNKLTYAVTVALTSNAQSGGFLDRNVLGSIQVVTGFGGALGTTPLINNTTAAYAVISHGMDAFGAVALNYAGGSPGWCPVPATYTLKDYNCTAASNKVASSFYNDGDTAGFNYFDDVIVTGDKAGILASGNLYCWGTDSDGKGILADGSTVGGHQYTSPNPSQSSVIFAKFKDSLGGSNAFDQNPCALTPDGTVYCWGSGVSVPQRVETNIKFSKLFARDGVFMGLTSDGTAYCWGGGWNGTCGTMMGPNTAGPTVPLPTTSEKFVSFAIGWDSLCGLTTTDKVLCWGSRQLGHGLEEFSTIPTEVWGNHFFSKLMVQQGGQTYCAITTPADPSGEGKIFCWGYNTSGAAGAESRIGIISNISNSTPIVVTTSVPHGFVEGDDVTITHVQGMGNINGVNGTLRNVTATTFELWLDRYHPESSDSTSFPAYTGGGNITPTILGSPREIAGGVTFGELLGVGIAFDLSNKLFSWGDNSAYNLVDGGTWGDATNGQTQIDAIAMTQTSPVHVTTGAPHNLTTDDYVNYRFWNWGSVDDSAPQLPNTYNMFRVVVTGPTTFDLYNLNLTPVDGTGYIPYTNADGGGHFFPIWAACSDQWGNHCSPVPVAASGSQTFTDVKRSFWLGVGINPEAGAAATLGWGSGNIGDGTGNPASTETSVAMPSGVEFSKIFGWDYGSMLYGMTNDGYLYSWGSGANGSLGLGTTADASRPTAVVGNFKWLDVTNASSNPYYGAVTCAIRDVSCQTPWGDKVEHGDSVTAFKDPSGVCLSEVRTCTMGVLSGSFANQSCM